MGGRTRVLFVIPNLKGGGAQRVFTTILNGLDRSRFEPLLAVGHSREGTFLREISADIPVYDFNSSRTYDLAVKTAIAVWRIRPNVVVSTLDHLNAALAGTRRLWPKGTKLVIRPTRPWPLEGVSSYVKRSFRGADGAIFQTSAIEASYRAGLGSGLWKSAVIGNPIDIQLVRHLALTTDVNTGYDSRFVNLVAAGRLEHVKGYDLLLEALSLLRRDDIRLTILGEGSERDRLKARISTLGLSSVVRLAGFVENPYPFFLQADAFVLSSRHETFPNVLLESLACGTPVVATPVPSVCALVRKLRECELACEFGAISLAKALSRFLGGRRFRVPDGVVDEYAADYIVGEYEEVLCSWESDHRGGSDGLGRA